MPIESKYHVDDPLYIWDQHYKKAEEDMNKKRKKLTKLEKRIRNIPETCRRHGISREEYDILHHNANGKCEICGEDNDFLVIDHDHKTMIVRGLLCNECNCALGLLKEDVLRIDKLLAYIKKHEQHQEIKYATPL